MCLKLWRWPASNRRTPDDETPALHRYGKALLNQRVKPSLAHALIPARQPRAAEGKLVLKELLAAEMLKIGVLDPNLAQPLVGQVLKGDLLTPRATSITRGG